MIEFAIISLVILNMGQLIFWSWQVQKLLNKLMSRTYYEYAEAAQIKPQTKTEIADDPMNDTLMELNQIIPRA